MKSFLFLFILLITASGLHGQTTSFKITMAEYMGINTNVAAYDNKYLADLSKCVKWIREYHDWSHYEAANNYYKWDNITTQPQGYTWPEHTDFMKECRKLGISVLIDVLGKPSWAGTSPIPITTGTGSNASDYLERLEFIGQLVARYGSKTIHTSLLETADKTTGLNFIKYFEDDNEPDYTWKTPRWTAENYAKYCNAVHDGFGVQTDTDHPLLGIKSVDPDAMHVMAGLASSDTIYLSKVMSASGGRVPFDVLNMHWYCTDMTNAYSPENEKYGYEISFRKFFKWKKRVVPDIPVWMTEFGWDTYLAPDSKHSYTYAPALQQANYLMRSYLVLLQMGFEKAFLFMDTDSDSKNILQYSTSGLLADKNSKYTKKISWYYLTTMQNVLGYKEIGRMTSYQETVGNNEVYCLKFENNVFDNVYAIWTRRKGSNNDEGIKTDYQLQLDNQPHLVYSVIPTNNDMDGDTIVPIFSDLKVKLELSETPQFVFALGNVDGISLPDLKGFGMKVYPNPANSEVQIAITVSEKQKINISAYTADGKLVKTLFEGEIEDGVHHYSFGNEQLPGTYFLSVNSKSGKTVRKVILVN